MTYSELKAIVIGKHLSWQFEDSVEAYHVFAYDESSRIFVDLFKSGHVPDGVDATQNTTDYNDFETNYKPTANKLIGSRLTGPDGQYIAGVNANKELQVRDADLIAAIGGASITVSNQNADISISTEFSLSSKTEADVPSVTYTVTAGKTFYLVALSGASDSPSPLTYRLKVAGVTKKIIKLGQSGGETRQLLYPTPAKLAVGGQIIKVTYDANFNRGNGWVEFIGLER